jgi:hypothetical protein
VEFCAHHFSRCFQGNLAQIRRSFVDRQYSPSTSMDRSEWEINLEELTRTGFLVKLEPVSKDEDQ